MALKADVQSFDYHVIDFDKDDVFDAMVAAAAQHLAKSGMTAKPVDDKFKPTVIMDQFGCKVYFKSKSTSEQSVPKAGA